MITAQIGHDHFIVWKIPITQAKVLVPGLTPVISNGWAWLFCAVAQFHPWRIYGISGLAPLRTAAWLVPCVLNHGHIGNAFVHQYLDHALIPHGWALGGWTHTPIRITAHTVIVSGQASARAGTACAQDELSWFSDDRCGLIQQHAQWFRWPIAKCDWRWSFRSASITSEVAKNWNAQPYGLITVHPTLAKWGKPVPFIHDQRQRIDHHRAIPQNCRAPRAC
jgi:hypothetical protein